MIDCSRSVETPFAVFELLIVRIEGVVVSGDFIRSNSERIGLLHAIFIDSKRLTDMT